MTLFFIFKTSVRQENLMKVDVINVAGKISLSINKNWAHQSKAIAIIAGESITTENSHTEPHT